MNVQMKVVGLENEHIWLMISLVVQAVGGNEKSVAEVKFWDTVACLLGLLSNKATFLDESNIPAFQMHHISSIYLAGLVGDSFELAHIRELLVS